MANVCESPASHALESAMSTLIGLIVSFFHDIPPWFK
jgi:hypothetical protein